jgi:predicted MPP superfamily phosphohydrolase
LRVTIPDHLSFRLNVVQLSDLHVERTTRRERAVLDSIEALAPDLILLTGDYLNLSYVDDRRARQDTRALLRQLDAPLGVYAIAGTPVVDTEDTMTALFDGLDNIQVLDDDAVSLKVAGKTLNLIGVSNLGLERDRKSLHRLAKGLPQEDLTVLLYHTPDLIETATEVGIDLYLAGHTHGGQIRLPWFGAILTASRYGKRYEAGLYQHHETHLYVSRGIGMEGLGMPRVRFLCPPEIVHFDCCPGE